MKAFSKQTYSQQVADYIRDLILTGDLKPGSPIKEADIAQNLNISRAPVREAMQSLIREGLIESFPQKRKYIKALTAQQIRNSYFTGGVLEAAAVAEVLEKYTNQDIAELEEIVSKMKLIVDQNGSVADLAPLDDAFHYLLLSRINNDLIVELCKRTCQGISKFLLFQHWVKLFPAGKVYERHEKVLDAVKTKDPAIVEKVIRKHYIESGERMAAYGTDIQ